MRRSLIRVILILACLLAPAQAMASDFTPLVFAVIAMSVGSAAGVLLLIFIVVRFGLGRRLHWSVWPMIFVLLAYVCWALIVK